ncbi:MAG: MFS transporter [Chloroflexi bacterium]|nr:MFS transporter [Chloroflexota bacterium]
MSELLKDNRRLLSYIIVSNLLMSFGFQVWQALFNNYAVEEMSIGPAAVGLVQAVREVPGLLSFLLGVLALVLSEVRIMALSTILLGAGIVLTGGATNLTLLLVSTLVMSTGFHFFTPGSSALVLMAVKQDQTPRILGQLASLGSIAALAATAVVYLLAGGWGYRTLFVVVGAVVLVGGMVLWPLGPRGEGLPVRRRVVLRRRYWLYYALAFLMGSRRHIFTTFAIYLLVREHGISVQTTAVLFLINSLVNIYTLRAAGQLVGRFGERRILSLAFISLAVIFVGYAYVTYLPILFVLFVLDNILFGAGLAVTTYFQKIAISKDEITGNVSVEQAINHISAVVVPLIGGLAWETFGTQAPFLVGVLIVLAALGLVQMMRVPPPEAVAVEPALP